MAENELLKYIKTAVDQGYSLDKIKQALIQRGWPPRDVYEAMRAVSVAKPNLSYFAKLKNALFSPSLLFESVQGDGIWPAYQFVLITAILTGLLASVVLSLAWFNGLVPFLDILFVWVPLIAMPVALITLLVALLSTLSFVSAALLHVSAKLLNGEGNFTASYAAVAYSLAPVLPGVLLALIPVIGQLVGIWQLFILISAPVETSQITPFGQPITTPETVQPITTPSPPETRTPAESSFVECYEKEPANWCFTSRDEFSEGESCQSSKEACASTRVSSM